MPYLNIDDRFADHPKVDALSDGAFRLHVSGLCYCAANTTDGVIPAGRVQRLSRTFKSAHLAELLRAGIWHKHPEGYEIHDYLDWNRSAEWWATRRAADTARKAEWRRAREAKKAATIGTVTNINRGGVTS